MTRPIAPTAPRVIRWVVTAAILIPFVWAALGLDVSLDRLVDAPGAIWNRVTSMFPPDWGDITEILGKVLESVNVAWIGTIIGAALSLPLGYLAATNISPRWVTGPVRGILSAIRAFPELVLAIMFIPAFGLGPFSATLAIGLHSIGTLGKLTSEVLEGTDAGPVEAIASAGGTKLQQLRFGVSPQAMPNIIAYWLYRFEINIRASAVLGVIGAGGVGDLLIGRLRFREWQKAGAVLLITVAVVLIIDFASSAIRRRIITGHSGTGRMSKALKLLVKPRAT